MRRWTSSRSAPVILAGEIANGEARFRHSASGAPPIFHGMHSSNIYQEIFMKGIAKAILVSGFILASQAAMADGSAFPGAADDAGVYLPANITYASQHANGP